MSNLGQPKQYVPVFVGSTYEDLKEYRNAVREALHRLEAIVRGMEYFGSKPRSLLEECLKAVRSCRVYVGIFAMRYGSLDEESGKSMTHLEYEEAARLGLSVLIYLIDEQSQPILPGFVETGEGAKKLLDLKTELKNKYTVSFFTPPEDLAKRIVQDLPPVLEGIGVAVDPDAPEIESDNAAEILKRFEARPAKYARREITILCTITGDVSGVGSDECSALDLPLGDAIERRVKSEILVDWSDIIGRRKMTDWLEAVETGAEFVVRLRLISGEYSDVEFSEDGPIRKTNLVRGYQVVEVVQGPGVSAQQSAAADAAKRRG